MTYDERRVISYTEQENTFTYTYPRANAAVSNTLSKQDTNGSRWTYVYDETNSLILETTNPTNHKEIWTYNENSLVQTYTDKEGHTCEYAYDSNGRQVYSKDPLDRETRWEYQANRPWPVKITSPGARVMSYVYDSRGNPTRITDPAGVVNLLEYNQFGDLTADIDPLGNRTTFTYNELGSLQPSLFVQLLRLHGEPWAEPCGAAPVTPNVDAGRSILGIMHCTRLAAVAVVPRPKYVAPLQLRRRQLPEVS